MQDRPTAQELIDAVADFIGREINPTVNDQRLRFRGLIAANVLTIVKRELAVGDAPLQDEWHRLAALLGRDATSPVAGELRETVQALTHELCASIRAGEADEAPRAAEVFAHARATVIEKLRIANPRFLERVLGTT